jgi:glutathione reductase (NADPH)
MAAEFDLDFLVIGGGSGGVRAARIAGDLGAKVALVEADRLGGTCVNVGCIPKKLLVYGAELGRDIRDGAGFGWSTGSLEHNYRTLVDNMDLEILRLNAIYQQLLERAQVEIIRGHAELLGGHEVRVPGRVLRARHILIATGGTPQVPEVEGKEHGIVSDQAFALRELPKRVAIVGAGYIGVEFAGIYNGLGAEVALVLREEHVLRGFDGDLRIHLGEELERSGIKLYRKRQVTKLEKRGSELRVTLNSGELLELDMLLFATGRVPRTQGLGLERAGVELDERGAVVVDRTSKTSVDHIYAVGDVTMRHALTPVALAEGQAVARTLFAGKPSVPDYEYIPTAVFSQPNLGTVGLTEEQARARHPKVDVYRANFRSLKHALTQREKRTLMKLVVDAQSDRVLGLHMVGEQAGEIIQGFAVAMKMGATKADFDATIGVHPTAAEEFVTMRTKVSS